MTTNRITIEEACETLTKTLGYEWTWWHTGGGCYALHGDQTALPWFPESKGYILLTHGEGPYDWTDERDGIDKSAPIMLGMYEDDDSCEPFMTQTFASWDEMMSDAIKSAERVR